MERFSESHASAHIVIAGGGFGALETMLALWAMGNERVRVTLVAPEPTFSYRPAATIEAFGDGPPRGYDLQSITSDLGATYRKARLESVGSQQRYVRLSSGSRLTYDALVLAVGARATATVAGASMFRDQRDVPLFRRFLRDMETGAIRRLVFAVPSDVCWPLPLYELALLSATHAAENHLRAEIILVSPERTPLELFGARPSRMVESLLVEHGVSFLGNSAPDRVREDGSLVLISGTTIEADRVVATPQLRGQSIAGVPANWSGFVPTDAIGRVENLPNVYAAGDMTTSPIKQAGVAAQQADRIAQRILTAGGTPIMESRTPTVLQARLVGGEHPLVLRAELDEHGQATSATLTRTTSDNAAVSSKVLARYLTPYLEASQSRHDLVAAGDRS
jgi:sulfide:quinone oxidoreductase